MEGMSEREYAAHAGLSRGAIQKAKTSGRLVQQILESHVRAHLAELAEPAIGL